jgi:glucose/arabinose dehydrogenase
MQGGGAGSLDDKEWKYGGDRDSIFRSIRDGILDAGMPAYGEALTKDQIYQIVDAILGHEVAPATPVDTSKADVVTTLDYQVAVEKWVTGFNLPWSIAFLDNSTALVTERDGPVRLIRDGILHPQPIADTPAVLQRGQGGMMVAVPDPEYAQNGWIYLAFSDPGAERNTSITRVVRGRITDHHWTDNQDIWKADAQHYTTAGVHFGTRIVFDRAGHLYFAIGDRGQQQFAQDLARPNGKIFRLNRDGSIPADNPFVNTPGALPSIFSYGHRNPQGLDFHPLTDELWEAEHGPRGGDEVNISRAGLNYGWPEITYGINYSGTIITRERVRPGMEQPIWFWRPSTAVCAVVFYRGDEFPMWRNHLLAGALANETLRLLRVENNRVIHEEILLQGRGRIRDVHSGPDGAIYLVMNDPHEILRLTSAGETKY